jgi:hypothetical protein
MRSVWSFRGGRYPGGSAAKAYRQALFGGVAMAALMVPGLAAAQDNPSSAGSSSAATLPEIRVIGTSPVPPPRQAPRPAAATGGRAAPATRTPTVIAEPGAVELDKIPSNVQTVPASAFEYAKSPDLLQSLAQSLPGVSLTDQTGNQFQLDLNYRGFTASPVIGTPQGIAVYQNGVRPAGATAHRRPYDACLPTLAHAAIELNFTSASPVPTTTSALQPQRRWRC